MCELIESFRERLEQGIGADRFLENTARLGMGRELALHVAAIEPWQLYVPEGVDTIFNSRHGVAGAYERDPIELPKRVIVFDDKNGGAIIRGFFPS